MFSHSVVSNSFATPRTAVCQAPLSVGLPRHESWSEKPFLLHQIFPNQGLDPQLLHWQADSPPLSGKRCKNLLTWGEGKILGSGLLHGLQTETCYQGDMKGDLSLSHPRPPQIQGRVGGSTIIKW